MKNLVALALLVAGGAAWAQNPVEKPGGHIDLPNSKQIVGLVPGDPQRLNSLPVALAVSPDGRYVVTVNGGYGSFEGRYMQGLAVLDTRTGKVEDFPDERTLGKSRQVLFSGLAFSADGKRLYGTVVSVTDVEGDRKDPESGAGIQVYGFADGKPTRERVLKIPLQKLAAGKTTKLGPKDSDGTLAVPYPAAIAVVPTRCSKSHPCKDANFEPTLVADNLSDDVIEMDASTGQIIKRFDLSESVTVPATYPAALTVAKDGNRAFVGLWNASEIVELDLVTGVVGRKLSLLKGDLDVKPSSHPTSLAMAPDGQTVYVTLGNRDAVAAVDLSDGGFKLKGYFDTRLPGQTYYGALPESVAVSTDGSRLYVANLGSDAIAVIDTKKLTKSAVAKGFVEPVGFIPTEWMPMGVAVSGGKVYFTSGKGTGTGPNKEPQRPTPETADNKAFMRAFTYLPTLLHGSIASVDEKTVERSLKAFTSETLEDNRMKAAAETIAWDAKVAGPQNGTGPIKHVIYIIRENRTYDQLLGDLTWEGKPVGNGDKSLTMYGADITPNLHKLAIQFGVFDNFFDSGEVSGDGHVWSNAAINSDYNERTWQLNYRGSQRGYDYEGVVSQGIPLDQHIPDVAEPGTGYTWGNAEKHGKTHYNFGEFIASTFCTDKGASIAQKDSQMGPLLEGETCGKRNEVKPGEALPAEWGGGVNNWPWAIPLLAVNKPTKPELVGHYATEAPDFNLRVPDQLRVNVFERHLQGWIADRKAGKDTMPNLITMRLGNDHTNGTTPGGPTPKSLVADNDLALGRLVEMISHSDFWDDTAICVLEDDAQNGGDHVDGHRSIALVVSKYSPRQANGAPLVDSRFYSTVSMVRTMETLLGLPPMNNNDAFSSLMGSVFTGVGEQPPYTADGSNRDNGLIYTANKTNAPGAKESAKMDFRHEDRADPVKLNVILWQDAMGQQPVPAMLLVKHKTKKDTDE